MNLNRGRQTGYNMGIAILGVLMASLILAFTDSTRNRGRALPTEN